MFHRGAQPSSSRERTHRERALDPHRSSSPRKTLGQGGCSHASAARCSGTAAQSARTLADDSGSLRRGQTSLSTNVRAAKRKPGTNRSNSEGYRQAFGHPLTQNVRHPFTLGSPEQLVRERRLRFSYEAFGFV